MLMIFTNANFNDVKNSTKVGFKKFKKWFLKTGWNRFCKLYVEYVESSQKKLVFEVELDHGIFKLFQAYITPYDIIHILSRHQTILFNTGQRVPDENFLLYLITKSCFY